MKITISADGEMVSVHFWRYPSITDVNTEEEKVLEVV